MGLDPPFGLAAGRRGEIPQPLALAWAAGERSQHCSVSVSDLPARGQPSSQDQLGSLGGITLGKVDSSSSALG